MCNVLLKCHSEKICHLVSHPDRDVHSICILSTCNISNERIHFLWHSPATPGTTCIQMNTCIPYAGGFEFAVVLLQWDNLEESIIQSQANHSRFRINHCYDSGFWRLPYTISNIPVCLCDDLQVVTFSHTLKNHCIIASCHNEEQVLLLVLRQQTNQNQTFVFVIFPTVLFNGYRRYGS